MNEVSITLRGTTYSGTYILTKGVLTVTYAGKSKSTQLGGMDAEMLAKQLLAEMPKG